MKINSIPTVSYQRFFAPVIIGSFLLTFVGLFLAGIVTQAAPSVITVTTTVDEDSHPAVGDGCSIYEASVAAATEADYGGCVVSPSPDGYIIAVPDGIYENSRFTGNSPIPVELTNTSLIGQSRSGTILQGYWLTLEGSLSKSLENLTMLSSSDPLNNQNVLINVYESNTTINGVTAHSVTPDLGSVQVALGEDFDSGLIENISINDFDTSPVRSAFAEISCATDPCEDITISNTILDGGFATINLTYSDRVTLDTVSMQVNNFGDIYLNENATVTNVSQSTIDSGFPSLYLSANEGSTLNGIRQEHENANSGSLSIAATVDAVIDVEQVYGLDATNSSAQASNFIESPLVEGYRTNATSVTFTNPLPGSTMRDMQFTAENLLQGSFSTYAATIEDILIEADDQGINSFFWTNNGDGAIVDNLVIQDRRMTPGDGHTISLLFLGDNVMRNSRFETLHDPSAFGIDTRMMFDGAMLRVENVLFDGFQLYSNRTEELYVANTRVTNALYTQALVVYAGNSVPFSGQVVDSIFENSGYGVNIYGADQVNSTVLIERSIFNDIAPIMMFNNPANAIATYEVGQTTIRDVVIDNVSSGSPAAIALYGGLDHEIVNTTIKDSTGAIYAAGYGDVGPTNVRVNNVTILDDNGTNPYSDAYEVHPALTVSGVEGVPTTMTVTNSLVSGQGLYVECQVLESGVIVADETTGAVDQSCIDTGMSVVDDTTLYESRNFAANNSTFTSIGPSWQFQSLPSIALAAGSEAIGLGDEATCETTDGRGISRVGTVCDSGAFQFSIASVPEEEETNPPAPTDPPTGQPESSPGPNVQPDNPKANPKGGSVMNDYQFGQSGNGTENTDVLGAQTSVVALFNQDGSVGGGSIALVTSGLFASALTVFGIFQYLRRP